MHNNFLMGVKFETSWGVDPRIFKNTLLERVFKKMVSNLSVLEGSFETKFQGRFFLFPKILKNTLLERVFEKMVSNLSVLEGIFEAKFQSWFFFENNLQGFFFRIFFSKDFPCFFEKKLKGFSLEKFCKGISLYFCGRISGLIFFSKKN